MLHDLFITIASKEYDLIISILEKWLLDRFSTIFGTFLMGLWGYHIASRVDIFDGFGIVGSIRKFSCF